MCLLEMDTIDGSFIALRGFAKTSDIRMWWMYS